MNTFRSCLRAYYFGYYGKRFLSGDDAKLWRRLNDLSLVAFVKGKCVHGAVEEIIGGLQQDRLLEVDRAVGRARDAFRLSLESTPLVEDYYGGGVGEEALAGHLEDVGVSVRSFYDSRWPGLLLDTPLWERRGWIVEPPGFGEFRLDGMKAYAIPDLMFQHKREGWYIVDWKTGKARREENLRQVETYIMFANDIYNIPTQDITGVVEYLMLPDEEPAIVHGSEVDAMGLREKVHRELSEMESMLVDVEGNKPKDISCFEKNVGEGCGWCKWREICNPY